MNMQCPNCRVHTTAEPAVVVGPVVLGSFNSGESIAASYSLAGDDISIVTCMACRRYFVVALGRPVWPLASPQAPDNVPEKVKEAYEDARLAHAAGANIGALMAARTAIIRLQRDKQVNSLKELADQQVITHSFYKGVDQLRLWAAIAGHDDIDTSTFGAQDVEDILDCLGSVLETVYTHPARVDKFISRTKELKNQPGAAK